MIQYSWLHLTDLHLGMKRLKEYWPGIEELLQNDLEYLLEKTGGPDVVLFTGDLVERGEKDEFDAVNDLLDRLWQLFRRCGANPKLAAVPGNHDLVRPNAKDRSLDTVTKGWDRFQDEFWSDERCPERQLVKEVFSNYGEWFDRCPLPKVEQFKAGLLPGDFSGMIIKHGVRLGIIGLNSTFRQLSAECKEGDLSLGVTQFHEACGGNGPAWAREQDACVLITHQPPNWLSPQAKQELDEEIYTPERFCCHLFGHQHVPSFRNIGEGGAAARYRIQGCSLFGLAEWNDPVSGLRRERLHGYSVGQLKLDGDKGWLRLWPRSVYLRQDAVRQLDRDQSYSLPTGRDCTIWFPVRLKHSIQQASRQKTPAIRPPANFLSHQTALSQLFNGGTRQQTLTFVGAPRLGKTLLLRHVQSTLTSDSLFAFVECDRKGRPLSLPECLEELQLKIDPGTFSQYDVVKRGIRAETSEVIGIAVDIKNYRLRDEDRLASLLSAFMDDLRAILIRRRLVLVIDDIDIAGPGMGRWLLERLLPLSQQSQNLSIAVTARSLPEGAELSQPIMNVMPVRKLTDAKVWSAYARDEFGLDVPADKLNIFVTYAEDHKKIMEVLEDLSRIERERGTNDTAVA